MLSSTKHLKTGDKMSLIDEYGDIREIKAEDRIIENQLK